MRRAVPEISSPLEALGAIALVAALAATLACGSGLPIRYYTLDAGAVGDRAEAAGARVVGVGPVTVAPPYDQPGIAYRPPGTRHEIAFYHYHRWAVPPAEAVRAGLVAALDGLDGVDARAVSIGEEWEPEVVLAVRVTRLEEVDDSEDSIRVVLAMTVEPLAEERGEDGGAAPAPEPLRLELEAPVAERSVEAVVEAFAAALREAAARIAEQL